MNTQAPGYSSHNPITLDSGSDSDSDQNFEDALDDFSQVDIKCENSNLVSTDEHIWSSPQSFRRSSPCSSMQSTPARTNVKDELDYLAKNYFVFVESLGYFYSEKRHYFISSDSKYASSKLYIKSKQRFLDLISKLTKQSPYYNHIERESNIVNVATIPSPIPGIEAEEFAFCDSCKYTRNIGHLPVKCASHGYMRRGEGYRVESGGFFLLKEFPRMPSLPATPPPSTPNVTASSPTIPCSSPIHRRSRFTNRDLEVEYKGPLITKICVRESENMTADAFLQKYANIIYIPDMGLYWHEHERVFLDRNSEIVHNSLSSIIDKFKFLETHMHAVMSNSYYWFLLASPNTSSEVHICLEWLKEPLHGLSPSKIQYCPDCINSAIIDDHCEVDNLNVLTGMGYRMESGTIFLLSSGGGMTDILEDQREEAPDLEYYASDSGAVFSSDEQEAEGSVDYASDMENLTVDGQEGDELTAVNGESESDTLLEDEVQEGDFRSFDDSSDSDNLFVDDAQEDDEEMIDIAIDNDTESDNDESDISAYDTSDYGLDNEYEPEADLLYDEETVRISTVSGWSQLKKKGICQINNLLWSRGQQHFLDITSRAFRSFLMGTVSNAQYTQMLEDVEEWVDLMPQYYRMPIDTKGRTFEILRPFPRLPPNIHTYCSECGFVIGFNENNENLRSSARHAKNTGHDRFISREGYAIRAATGFNLLVILGSSESISTCESEDGDYDDEDIVIPSFDDGSGSPVTHPEFIVEPYSTDEEASDYEQEPESLPPPSKEEEIEVSELLRYSHGLVYDPIFYLYYYITEERYVDVNSKFFKNTLEDIGDHKSRIRNLVDRVISTQIIDSSKFEKKVTRGHIHWAKELSKVAYSKKLCFCKQCYQIFKTKTAFSRHRRDYASMVGREHAGHDTSADFKGYLLERPKGLYYAIGIPDDVAEAEAAATVEEITGSRSQWVMGGPGWTAEEYESKVKWLEVKLGMLPDQFLAKHNYLLVKELGLYYDFTQKWFRSITHRLSRKVFFADLVSSVRSELISYMLHNMDRKYEYMLAPRHQQQVATLQAAVKYDGPVVAVENGNGEHLDFELVDNCIQPTKYYMCHVCKFIAHHSSVTAHIKQAKHQREEGPEKHVVYGYSVRNVEAKTNYFRIQSNLAAGFHEPTDSSAELQIVDPFLSRYKAHEYTKFRSFLNMANDKRWPRLVQLCKKYVTKKRLALSTGSSLSALIDNPRFCSTPNSASRYGLALARFLYVAMKMCELKEHKAMEAFDQVFCANKEQGLRRFFGQMKIFGAFWLLSPVLVLQEDDLNYMDDIFMSSLMVCLLDEGGIGFKIKSYRCDFCSGLSFAFKCIAVDVMKKDKSYVHPFVEDCNKSASISLNFGRFRKFSADVHSLSPRTFGRTMNVLRVGDIIRINTFEVGLNDIKKWVYDAIQQYVLEVEELFVDINITPTMAMHEMSAAQKPRVVGMPQTSYNWDQRDIDRCLEINSVDKYDVKSLQCFRRRLSRLNNYFFCMILLTCGSPYRLTELYSVLIRNEERLGSNVFVADGMLGLFTNNGKNSMKYSRERPILKMLPEEVSECLAHYIYFVRPFEYTLVEYQEQTGSLSLTEFKKLSDKYKLHLFMGEKGIKSSTTLGKSFRKFINKTTPKLRGIMYGEIRQVLSYFVGANVSGMIGLQIKIDNTLAEQAGHSFSRFVESYATNRDGYNHVMLQRMRDCSAAWHTCLEMRTLQIFTPSIFTRNEPPKLTGEELLEAGRKIFGQQFRFKEGQQQATSDVANCFSMMVAINSGKTTCCIIAMLAERTNSLRRTNRGKKTHCVTIFVVPYISTLNSTIRQLTENFKVHTYDGSVGQVNNYDVLLMSLEDGHLRHLDSVVRHIQSTNYRGKTYLRRVVVDDAHILQMKQYVIEGNKNVPIVFLTSFLSQKEDDTLSTLFNLESLVRVSSQEPLLPHKEFTLFKKPNTTSICQTVIDKVRSLGSAIVIAESSDKVSYLLNRMAVEVPSIGIYGSPDARAAALNKIASENIRVVVTTAEAMVGLHMFKHTTVLFAYSINNPIELLVGSQLSSGKVEMVLLNFYSTEFQRDLLDTCVNLMIMRHMRLTEQTCYEAGKERCHACVNKRRHA